MRLAKGPALWLAERRGRVVYTRRGKISAPGIPKARELKSEEAAQAFLEAERDKRLADGFVMLDETAGLDTPFTATGRPRERTVPRRYEEVASRVVMVVRSGLKTRAEVDALIDGIARDLTQLRLDERAARTQPAMTMEERYREADVRARVKRDATNDDDDGGQGLRELLGWVADTERTALRAKVAPTPCVNDGIDAAFEQLQRQGIVALQGAGFTQSDGWAEANGVAHQLRARGTPPRGACFYQEQDLERAIQGKGLALAFGAYTSNDAEHDAATIALGHEIVAVLRAHGVDAAWAGDPTKGIAVAPFAWYRRGT
ncbi:MAG: hypothetical protein NT062_05105 [Proteobacteria bacterium]|nr:hypothetical protein [Pseudomonadota bacterium]